MRHLWIAMALFACKGGKDEKAAVGSAAPPSAPTAPSAPAASSSSSGGCTHVAICTLIPVADANAKLGLKVTAAKPGSHDEGGRTADGCEYTRPGVTGRDLKIGRICIPDADEAKMTIDAAMSEPAKAGQKRSDLKLGDRAFAIVDPSLHRVDMTIAVGNALYLLEDVQVEAGQDAAAITGLTALAETLLKK
jgi:hypothetical protein